MEIASGWQVGRMGSLIDFRVSVLQGEEEFWSWMVLMGAQQYECTSQYCTIDFTFKIVNFTLFVFYHNKKKLEKIIYAYY